MICAAAFRFRAMAGKVDGVKWACSTCSRRRTKKGVSYPRRPRTSKWLSKGISTSGQRGLVISNEKRRRCRKTDKPAQVIV